MKLNEFEVVTLIFTYANFAISGKFQLGQEMGKRKLAEKYVYCIGRLCFFLMSFVANKYMSRLMVSDQCNKSVKN